MADNKGTGTLMLPPELWRRVLLDQTFDWRATKAQCLVCHLFADICQGFLFRAPSMTVNAGVVYENPAFDQPGLPRRAAGAKNWPEQEWAWEIWERNVRSATLSERRLALIGSHGRLSTYPRSLRITGYVRFGRDPYPANPLHAPPERQMLSKAVFDALQDLRQTLSTQLPAFTSLQSLELVGYPVDAQFLTALNSHPTLTDIQFELCWFPEASIPLTSVTSLSFRTIPGSHLHPVYPIPDNSPYKDVPDHHVRSAFSLIYPSCIKYLDIAFGDTWDGHTQPVPVFRQLCAAVSSMGGLPFLRSLTWRFHSHNEAPIPVPIPLIFKILQRTPALRKLDIQGYPPPFAIDQHVPTGFLPLLDTLSCPLEWARALVPGRPLTDIRAYSRNKPRDASFFAKTGSQLEEFFGPFTLSTAPVTTLRLPPHPPVAPASLLFPYITAMFPALRHLQVAVAEECVAPLPIPWRSGAGTMLRRVPCIDTTEQIIEAGLIEKLQRDVREDVERVLNGGPTTQGDPGLPPVLDRIMTFRGIPEPEDPPAEVAGRPFTGLIHPPVTVVPRHISFYKSSQPRPGAEVEPPLERFGRYFGGQDGQARSKPQTSLDILYFLARGYYTLPSKLETLSLPSCFGDIQPGRYSPREGPSVDGEDYEACTRATLVHITGRFVGLRGVGFLDSNQSNQVLYNKKEGGWHRRPGYTWELHD